ncbi:chemotaxis protein CheB [Deinococcus hohokamensis]|uniref:protein-glutamate methylesterase n=1 Tax=Deinococcus hohokamensis TaxID=309883 RepID=A0ABV9I6P3_9DEIO
MNAQPIVVIGGSAGALGGLLEIVRQLPRDFPAAVLVVIHVSPDYPSRLPALLNAAGPLEARTARSGERPMPGCIYVAPPDHHLLCQDSGLLVSRGPKENRARPSIDVLFRSAAYTHGPQVTGVLLSGMLDDGTSGLWTIKHLGGHAIVQHPEEAEHPSMPLSAVRRVEVDEILPVRGIGPSLLRMVRGPEQRGEGDMSDQERRRVGVEVGVAAEDNAFGSGILGLGPMSTFTCPECHGVMVRLEENGHLRFRCHTGHAFTAAALLSELRESVEATLWSAVRVMDENVMLLEHLGKHFGEAGDVEQQQTFAREVSDMRSRSRSVRELALQTAEHQHEVQQAVSRAEQMTGPSDPRSDPHPAPLDQPG